jgi:hypothetical protein
VPDLLDRCLWCNREYGKHQAGSVPHCPNGGGACGSPGSKGWDTIKFFAPQSSVALEYFPIGTKIAYYTDADGDIIEDHTAAPSLHFGVATIRALANPVYPNGNSMLLAWSATDQVPNGAWDVHSTLPEYAKLMTRTDAYGFWVLHETPVKHVISMSMATPVVARQVQRSQGMHCCRSDCKTFNDFAEPNQPDGTFMCYSCRQRGW